MSGRQLELALGDLPRADRADLARAEAPWWWCETCTNLTGTCACPEPAAPAWAAGWGPWRLDLVWARGVMRCRPVEAVPTGGLL